MTYSTQNTYCTHFTQNTQLKCLTLFWLYDPAFGDSNDEDMHLNDALGEDTDEVESILHGNVGELGDYNALAVLPDKMARYMYDFHADCYANYFCCLRQNQRQTSA